MKKLLFAVGCLLIVTSMYGQYNPGLHTVTSKPLAINAGGPTDARSFFYDASLFKYRPYQSTAEVLAYLNLAKYRVGYFPVYINVGGTLSGGVFTGGTVKEYVFLAGTTDGDLIEKPTGTGSGADSSLMASKYRVDTATKNIRNTGYLTGSTGDSRYPLLSGSYSNPSWIASLPASKITGLADSSTYVSNYRNDTAKTNLRTSINTKIGSGTAAGGDLTGTYANPTLKKVNNTPVATLTLVKQIIDTSGRTLATAPATSSDFNSLMGGTVVVGNGSPTQFIAGDGSKKNIEAVLGTFVPTRDSATKYTGGAESIVVYADSPYNGTYVLKNVTWADNGTTIITPINNSSKRLVYQPFLNSGGATSSGAAGVIQASNGSGGLQAAGSMLYVSAGFDSLFWQSGTPKDFIIKASRLPASVNRTTRIFGIDNSGTTSGGGLVLAGGKGIQGNGGDVTVIGNFAYNNAGKVGGSAIVSGAPNDSTNTAAGLVLVKGGDATAGTAKAGNATVRGGDNSATNVDGGDATFRAGNSTSGSGTGKGGDIFIYAGKNLAGAYQTANMFMDSLAIRNPATNVLKFLIDSSGNVQSNAWATGSTKYLSVDASGNVIPASGTGSSSSSGVANLLQISDGAGGFTSLAGNSLDGSGNLAITGTLTTSGGIQTNGTATNANLATATNGTGALTSNIASSQVLGSTSSLQRVLIGGNTTVTATNNQSVGSLIIRQTTFQKPTGNVPWFGSLAVIPNQLNNNGSSGTVGSTSTVLIAGAPPVTSTDSVAVGLDVIGGIRNKGVVYVTDSTTSATTVQITNATSRWYSTNTATCTWTLPRIGASANAFYLINNLGTNAITLNAATGETNTINTRTSTVSTVTISAGSYKYLKANSAGTFWVVEN